MLVEKLWCNQRFRYEKCIEAMWSHRDSDLRNACRNNCGINRAQTIETSVVGIVGRLETVIES